MNGHQSSQMLVDSVEKLLVDRSFGPPSEITVACRSTGERLSQWLAAAENQEKARAFSDTLFFSLDDCFNQRGTGLIEFEKKRCGESFIKLDAPNHSHVCGEHFSWKHSELRPALPCSNTSRRVSHVRHM